MSKALWFVAGAVLFLSFGYTEMQGSDLWWHLAAGREIIQTKTLWLVDDWSFSSAGNVWRNHEWLSDIIFYSWASIFGVTSLVYWKWLLVILTFLGLQRVLHRASGSLAASFVCAGFAIAIAAPFIDVRPHLYSLLNFSILLLLLYGKRAATWPLALLFVVWVNLHGGFFFGIMALGILLFPWRDINPATVKSALGVGMFCVLACMLNPSGIKSFLYPLTYAFDSSSPFRSLGEWLSPFKPGGIQSPLFFWAIPAALLSALAYLIPQIRRSIAIPWEGLLLCGLTLAMALTSRRFVPLFGMSFALVLAPLLGLALRRLGEEKYSAGLALVALVFALLRQQPFPLAAGPAYHYLTAEYSYPVDTLDFMRVNNIEGNVYALYNWGGYIHWRTDGDLKVFIDGRADTIYGARTYLDYVDVLATRPGWLEKVKGSGAQYFLWPTRGYGGSTKAQQLLESGGWNLIYQDSVSYLLVTDAAINSRNFRLGPDSPYRELGVAQVSLFKGDRSLAIERASKAHREIPYHKAACNILYDAYTAEGDRDAAEEISRECRAYFPSNQLRR